MSNLPIGAESTALNEQRKLSFARYCWKHRNEFTVNLFENERGKKERITYAALFFRKYKQTLDDYKESRSQR